MLNKQWLSVLIRFYFFCLLNVGLYIFAVYNLFFFDKLIYWSTLFILLFFALRFLCIEIPHLKPRVFGGIIFGAMVIAILLKGFDNLVYLIWIILFHLTLASSYAAIYEEVYNRKTLSFHNMFFAGSSSFSFLFSVIAGLVFIAIYSTVNFTCDQLLGLRQYVTYLQQNSNTPVSGSNLIKDTFTINWTTIETAQILEVFVWSSISDKRQIDKDICQIFLDRLKVNYEQGHLKLSVIALFTFLLWPITKAVLLVISYLFTFLFWILTRCKVYKKTEVMDRVEVIE